MTDDALTLGDIYAAVLEQQAEMRADPTLIPHLYLDKGWGITQIARHVGLDRSTVYRRLDAAGVYKGPGKSGPPRLKACKNGHNMDKWGVEKTKEQGGGRYCRKCKQKRERVAWKRRNERKA